LKRFEKKEKKKSAFRRDNIKLSSWSELAIRPPTDRTITPASKPHPRLSPNNNTKSLSKRKVIASLSPAITQHHAPEFPHCYHHSNRKPTQYNASIDGVFSTTTPFRRFDGAAFVPSASAGRPVHARALKLILTVEKDTRISPFSPFRRCAVFLSTLSFTHCH